MHAVHESVVKAMVEYHRPSRRPERRQAARPGRRRDRAQKPKSQPDKKVA